MLVGPDWPCRASTAARADRRRSSCVFTARSRALARARTGVLLAVGVGRRGHCAARRSGAAGPMAPEACSGRGHRRVRADRARVGFGRRGDPDHGAGAAAIRLVARRTEGVRHRGLGRRCDRHRRPHDTAGGASPCGPVAGDDRSRRRRCDDPPPILQARLKALDLCEVSRSRRRGPGSAAGTRTASTTGWSAFRPGLAIERLLLAAISVGAGAHVLELSLAHANCEEAFGRPIGAVPADLDKLARRCASRLRRPIF